MAEEQALPVAPYMSSAQDDGIHPLRGIDLRLPSLLRKRSFVIMDDHLVLLAHQHMKDRVQRISFDRIDSILIWSVIPWVRMLIWAVLFGLPALGIFLINDPVATVIAIVLLTCLTLIELYYLLRRKTSIRITRAGVHTTVCAVVSRRKVRRFAANIAPRIRQTQRLAEQRAADHQADRTAQP
jgi:hypothetical protein